MDDDPVESEPELDESPESKEVVPPVELELPEEEFES